MYSPELLDHFEHPRNAGTVDHADASVQVENPACGDVLRLTAKLSRGRIVEVKFQAKGCVPSIACASALTEVLVGKTLADASALRREELIHAVGGLPQASTHASHLALDALSQLVGVLKRHGGNVDLSNHH